MKYMPKFLPALLTLLPMLTGCASLSYYSQAISGHFSLMANRQPIRQVLEDKEVDEALKSRLLLVQSIRDFASTSLKLPDNGSYRSFVPMSGEAVVWSLVATGAFSIEPRQWCYPIIGCASYRGYFDLEVARRQLASLEAEGLDVALEPVPAYSTLGWFDDPLPGTVVNWNDWQLAGLIFHELAHQRLYVAGDSAFNEAFANQVQRAGVATWLDATSSAHIRNAWRLSLQRESAFVHLLLDTRE
ncbi:MAG TPA: aminopeptidase, partial [Gammaproteobacteria bacterium]|nr:aminopeptidase [Gammaproteobacteria bacterium]